MAMGAKVGKGARSIVGRSTLGFDSDVSGNGTLGMTIVGRKVGMGGASLKGIIVGQRVGVAVGVGEGVGVGGSSACTV